MIRTNLSNNKVLARLVPSGRKYHLVCTECLTSWPSTFKDHIDPVDDITAANVAHTDRCASCKNLIKDLR